ncbi:hypothetical protein SYNPS1DRAFT_28125 [Syncephalis pseudoplumigaleata]|uniref:Uncharacterized protein n=1 Tax=Syncephalis pseudoplumigaleata TaxID=1712513 RepID=A0A4P9Z118_9FUNG|nr:hypothetical protein SYNPS1DRAFT_28125 [Syncephalis pseudoplumigaleata]|eukprot:RKP26173.1 hypothetical protein SYNPS1DRAFT_28125 [Syncephalis pseudoplumigaleata]
MAPFGNCLVRSDQNALPDGFDINQSLFDDYDDIDSIPELDDDTIQVMFPPLGSDTAIPMPVTAAASVDVAGEMAAFDGSLDVPDIADNLQPAVDGNGLDATVGSQVHGVAVVHAPPSMPSAEAAAVATTSPSGQCSLVSQSTHASSTGNPAHI